MLVYLCKLNMHHLPAFYLLIYINMAGVFSISERAILIIQKFFDEEIGKGDYEDFPFLDKTRWRRAESLEYFALICYTNKR